ncbi:amino acid ABC transporter permease [Rhodovibrionaceae bacterium A322]
MSQEDSQVSQDPGPGVYPPGQHPDLPPPAGTVGTLAWIKSNLFDGPINTILTIVCVYLLYITVPAMLDWAFFSANFGATSKAECVNPGACWAVVEQRFGQFMYGFYDADQRWRPNLALIGLILAIIPLLFSNVPFRKPWLAFTFVFPIIAFFLLYGGFGLKEIETSKWGGLLVTISSGVVGIAASLPIGVALALGRRSNMPVVRTLCVGFIEFIRGVPLITILFMSSVMLPLFLPEGVNFDKYLRALIGIALFSSAYMAEVVRGGLQAIPKGQYEAAEAMGLSYWKSMRLVILPQALKIVIPGIVNTFIGLYKDTTLLLIIGIFDLLGIAKASVADAKWIGLADEVYVFVGLLFFFSCFLMSRYSIYLENKLHTGHKR